MNNREEKGSRAVMPDFGSVTAAIRRSKEHKKLEGKDLPIELRQKLGKLKLILKSMETVAVAFSGGVDSTLLLYAAQKVLGKNAVAVSAESAFVPGRESGEARFFCKDQGVHQIVCRIHEGDIPNFCENPADRCYHCKKAIFSRFLEEAEQAGFAWVAEGSNMDDEGDYRPGLLAIAELGIRSPLKEAGLYKQEIRELSEYFGLKTWNKPSYACLASRFVYGETITREKLIMVDQAEQYLLDQGFSGMRVRIHDRLARIEVQPEQQEKVFELRREISEKLAEMGFSYVTMDLQGYRTGSMNEVLEKRKEQE